MFLRGANGIRAARIVREASDPAVMQIADLLLRAIVMHLALDRLAADLVVFSVPKEAGLAGTRGGVIISPALGVTATEYQVARSKTLRLYRSTKRCA